MSYIGQSEYYYSVMVAVFYWFFPMIAGLTPKRLPNMDLAGEIAFYPEMI